MPTTTLSSREFHQNTSKLKRAAEDGPVIITDRGKPSLVLLTYAEFERLQPADPMSIAEALYMPGADEIDFELPERTPHVEREIDW